MRMYTLSNILDGAYYDISPLRYVYHTYNNDMHDYLIQVGNDGGKYYIPCIDSIMTVSYTHLTLPTIYSV